jgi:alpha-mannosidase
MGYRVYRYESGVPSPQGDAATVTPATRTIESSLYRVVLGSRGQITSAVHLTPFPQVEMAGPGGLNDFGRGTELSVTAENVGPVSATLRMDVGNPSRAVRITLYHGVDRIDIENSITQNETGFESYRFRVGLYGTQIRFEETGAVARPGMVWEDGDFLPGTRASRMTLNHFVDFEKGDYNIMVSNQDAFAMQVNNSTDGVFDLTGDAVRVIVMEQQAGAGANDQGGDTFFLNRFALRGIDSAFDGAEVMRTSLAHQNPLHVVELARNQPGSITEATGSLLSVDHPGVVVTAFKPAEDAGAGFVVRAWELLGAPVSFGIDVSGMSAKTAWETSLIETDERPAQGFNGVISASAAANEIQTYRFAVGAPAREDVTLMIGKDPSKVDIELTWEGGFGPFTVRRSNSPAPGPGWADLTTPEGTASYSWVDPGALQNPIQHFYLIENAP